MEVIEQLTIRGTSLSMLRFLKMTVAEDVTITKKFWWFVVAVEVLLLEEKEVLHKNKQVADSEATEIQLTQRGGFGGRSSTREGGFGGSSAQGEGSSDRAPRRSESFW
jgi:hypothetical protein